jgi:hypothetical protein
MERKLWFLVGVLLCSGSSFSQTPIRDGGGGGDAHNCIERKVTQPPQTPGWPVIGLHNACSKEVLVYYCGTYDDLPNEWRCNGGGHKLGSGESTTWGDMDSLKFACTQPNSNRPDPSCSRWKMVWNAVYKESNQSPARPDVPKPPGAQSGR